MLKVWLIRYKFLVWTTLSEALISLQAILVVPRVYSVGLRTADLRRSARFKFPNLFLLVLVTGAL